MSSSLSVNVADYLNDKELVKKTLSIPILADKLGKRMGINFSVLLTETISQQADEWLTPQAKKQ
ncbi:antitoxin HicB [Enterococcus columbae]|uniref:antitoxin HicB n=1 Tax=Enterococcus columbae TaxID=1355 RepID=UPI00116081AB|nr:antitoxin HicB [Enterococcus columbae]